MPGTGYDQAAYLELIEYVQMQVQLGLQELQPDLVMVEGAYDRVRSEADRKSQSEVIWRELGLPQDASEERIQSSGAVNYIIANEVVGYGFEDRALSKLSIAVDISVFGGFDGPGADTLVELSLAISTLRSEIALAKTRLLMVEHGKRYAVIVIGGAHLPDFEQMFARGEFEGNLFVPTE